MMLDKYKLKNNNMSANNGVYIAKFPDGYRVAYASAIDNIDYFPEGSQERKDELRNYFGDSKVFETDQDAFEEAKRIEEEFLKDNDDCPEWIHLEYGICYIGEYESFKT